MRGALGTFILMVLLFPAHAELRLPDSRHLAGPLDSVHSNFGDEFYNFPPIFGGRAEPGSTFLSGWIHFEFQEPEDGYADFRMTLNSVGTPDAIAFPGGQTYTLNDNRAATNPAFVSRARVNLQTGEVDQLELHALFQNSVIARVTKNIRIPFGFINDYPPTQLPIPLPFDDEPRIFHEARFSSAADGTITGFEFHGETIAPVTLFPRLGIFPPYSFGDNETFYFANPTGCLPDAPPANCINDENNPDGVALDQSAFFHPHLDLITNELTEAPANDFSRDCASYSVSDANGLVAVEGRLYLLGGVAERRRAGLVQVFDGVTGTWGTSGSMPVPVADGQAAAFGSRIYLMGGTPVGDTMPAGEAPAGLLQVLDTSTGEWSQLDPAPSPVSSGVTATLGNRIYFIGGVESGPGGIQRLTGKVQIYDPMTDGWSLGSDAPVPVADAAIAVSGSRIYLINGRVSADDATNEVWIYETSEDRWSPGPRTVRGVWDGVATRIGDRIYLAGGRTSDEGAAEPLLQILVMETNTWRRGLDLPIPVTQSAGTQWEGKFYLAGGRVQTGLDPFPGAATDVLQAYDPAGGWSVCASRPVFTSSSVLNAACGVAGPPDLSPGTRAVILGYNLAGSERTAAQVRWEGGFYTTDLPTELNGVRVTVDGRPAPLVAVAPESVEFQIPYGVEASSRLRRMVNLELSRADIPKQQAPLRIPLLAAAPDLYVYSNDEYRAADYLQKASVQARNADGFINHPDRPASPGERVTLYATGLGLVSPALEEGQRARDEPANRPHFAPDVTIGGFAAEVVSVRLAPHDVGIYLIEVLVPENVALSNNVPVRVMVNGVKSNVARLSIR